jgi:hypothetical protein
VRYKAASIKERDAAVERLREFIRLNYVTAAAVARRLGFPRLRHRFDSRQPFQCCMLRREKYRLGQAIMFKIVWLRDGGRPHDIGANADATRRNLRFSREWPRRIERASGFANRAVAHRERDSLARCRIPRRPWRAESIAAGPGGGARLPRGGHGEDGPLALHFAKEAAEREVEAKEAGLKCRPGQSVRQPRTYLVPARNVGLAIVGSERVGIAQLRFRSSEHIAV